MNLFRRLVPCSLLRALGFLTVLAITAAVYGAVPFYATPTMGQAVWVSSFARSFANGGWFTLFAGNFGYPQPAAMAFGLPGALVEAAILRLTPLGTGDAYATMILLFLALAAWGAIRFSRQLGLRFPPALAVSLVWLTTPMIWAHANYSLLSIGIALLPFYASVSLVAIRLTHQDGARIAGHALAFAAMASLSIFIDGYTFVMLALATVILLLSVAYSNRTTIRALPWIGASVCMFGLAFAYGLYTLFVGHAAFPTDSLDFFRAYGLDVTMLIFPTRGLFSLWDAIGLALNRNDVYYFGDASVWMTTFSPFVIAPGIAGALMLKRQRHVAALLIIALAGTYMSLGPSLKIHSLRPQADIAVGQYSPLMPAQDAIMPTGSAFLSTHAPGFKNMRASYRWMALGLFGFWALYALLAARLDRDGRRGFVIALCAATVLSGLPKHPVTMPGSAHDFSHANVKLRAPHEWRGALQALDATLVKDFRQAVPAGSVVAFVPQGNDFLAAYLAAQANARTFNAGGDKNVALASAHWPANIHAMFGVDPANRASEITKVLKARDANVVVVPFVDLLWDAHAWPPQDYKTRATAALLAPMLAQLQADPALAVARYPYFAIVQLQ